MKKLIMIIRVLVIIFLISPSLYSQNIQQGEFMIVNNSGENGYQIKVDIYPVGAIFNGNDQYTLKARYPIPQQIDKIWGVQQYALSNQTTQDWFFVANFDKSDNFNGCQYSLGYGRYRVDFYEGVNITFTCDVDFSDANFTGISTSNYYQQLRIDYYGSTDIKLQFYGANSSPYIITNGERLCVWEQKGTLNGTQTQNKGNFTDYSLDPQQYHDYPIIATQQPYGFFKHITPEEVYLNLKVTNFDANLIANNTLKFYNSVFTVDDGKTYTIKTNSNTIYPLKISGEGAKFVSGNESIIEFPENTGLKTELNAQIESNGTYFTSSSGYWEGISMDKPGGSSFNNCTFTNAKTSIYSLNNDLTGLSITNNTFNIPHNNSTNAYYGIDMRQTKTVSIISNHFYFPTDQCESNCGIGILNQANSEEDNNNAPWFRINIVDNYFQGGYLHISIASATDILSTYINDNIFIDGAWNMLLAGVTGIVSDNTTISNFLEFNCEGDSQNIFLIKTNSNFLNNIIIGRYNNFKLENSSNPNFAPLQIDNQFFWTAGKNKLMSIEYVNIWSPNYLFPGYFHTLNGNNEFNTRQGNYHLLGYLNDILLSYKSLGNCWKNGENQTQPIYDLKNIDQHPMEVIYDPPNCNEGNDQIVDRIITDMGNGIFDTVLVTQSSTIPPPSNDEALYGAGVKNKLLKNYSTAIINFKNLINTYPNSKHIGNTVSNLYECYVLSDTNRTQSFRNVIFGNLKNFLEDKIQQYENNDEFVNFAFDFTLKCKVKIKSYPLALDGYEFIAENSPSATERLMASLSYIDVEGLIQGHGGGVMENKNAYKAIGNVNTKENKTPIKDILLKVYSKENDSKKQKENLDLQKSNDISKTRTDLERKHNFEKTIEKRALNNISISGSLNAEQRRERIKKDLLLLTQKETDNNTTKEINSLPINYSLSQNYPNPFNPMTKINFALPKQAFVTLKIYDIIGREIKTLVNEVKQAGYYIVEFNGSSLASGVYFYRIQCGDFISVKRMVMVK